jgi:hypothetical protein
MISMRCARQRSRHLAHAAIFAAGIGVHVFQQLHFLFEARRLERIDVGVELHIAAGRAGGGGAGIAMGHGAHGAGGAGDGVLGNLGCMGIAGGFPRHRPQAKALAGVESRRFQPAIVKGERFGLAVFQVQFPVIGPFQRLIHGLLDPPPVHAGAAEEKIVVGHVSLRSGRAGQKALPNHGLPPRYRGW